MAILKACVTKNSNSLFELESKLVYITRPSATAADLVYGANISVVDPFIEMLVVKRCWGQEYGKAFHHFVIQIEEHEKATVDTMFLIGKSIADTFSNSAWGTFQSVMAVHTDKMSLGKNPHLHIIQNNIDMFTGSRFTVNRQELRELKSAADKILLKYQYANIRQNVVCD